MWHRRLGFSGKNTSGVVCSATISKFSGILWGLLTLEVYGIPEIEWDEPVTLEQCMTAKKGFYNSPDGKHMQISPGETILYQYIEDGSITVHPTNPYCEGVSLPLHQGTIADKSLVLTQIRFSMLREVYLRTRGREIAAKFSRVSLPSDCSMSWCLDGPRVYLMVDQAQVCPFKRIRSISLRPEGTNLMISDNLALLFNVTKKEVLLVPGCPQLTV